MVPELTRRSFMISASAAGGAVLLRPDVAGGQALETPWTGERIVDCHFHERPTDEALIAHLDGAGISNAMVLSGGDFSSRMAGLRKKHRGRISGWSRSSILRPDGSPPEVGVGGLPRTTASETLPVLRAAVRAGANGFAETVGVVAVDGPELRRLYALAAELDVPVMMHFQEAAVPGLPRYGITGFSRIGTVLKEFPKTRFICHASDFWGHIDSQYSDGGAYPSGKVNPGGLSERLLAEHPNMYGDLSAPSGLIQLSRDPEFTAGFLRRNQDKLVFGSDCGCLDGKGGSAAPQGASAMQTRMAAQGGLAGKCIARELLTVMWKSTDRSVFRKLAWENGRRVYKLAHA